MDKIDKEGGDDYAYREKIRPDLLRFLDKIKEARLIDIENTCNGQLKEIIDMLEPLERNSEICD